jgi:26S proteasome non-ATPase regulatory subunit 10
MLLEEGKSPVNATDGDGYTALHQAIAEGHGPAAILLLKSGADPLKRDNDDKLAIELVPDDKVMPSHMLGWFELTIFVIHTQVKQFILQTAEREGIELP